jgi:hypothetical protein
MSDTRLRIISDGTPRGTRVETEGGTLIKGVQSVHWHLELDGMATVSIGVLAVAADVVGLVETGDGGSMPEDPTSVPLLSVPQTPPQGPGFPLTEREVLALGWLSAELAGRADAWNGNAPTWFPQPPEWLDLWRAALKAADDAS